MTPIARRDAITIHRLIAKIYIEANRRPFEIQIAPEHASSKLTFLWGYPVITTSRWSPDGFALIFDDGKPPIEGQL